MGASSLETEEYLGRNWMMMSLSARYASSGRGQEVPDSIVLVPFSPLFLTITLYLL